MMLSPLHLQQVILILGLQETVSQTYSVVPKKAGGYLTSSSPQKAKLLLLGAFAFFFTYAKLPLAHKGRACPLEPGFYFYICTAHITTVFHL